MSAASEAGQQLVKHVSNENRFVFRHFGLKKKKLACACGR